jgi:hypothetical protein
MLISIYVPFELRIKTALMDRSQHWTMIAHRDGRSEQYRTKRFFDNLAAIGRRTLLVMRYILAQVVD